VARHDEPPLAESALSWLREDLPTSFVLLALLPALFPSHLMHAHHTLSIVASCRMSTREAVLIWPGKEENGRKRGGTST
jgi:hypothetical protein